MPSLSVSASRPKVKHPRAVKVFGFDFTNLIPGDTLTGTPTVVCVSAEQTITGGATVATTDLTIASVIVNVAAFDNDEGGSVAIGKGVKAKISGGVAGGDYVLRVEGGTVTNTETEDLVCTLQVRDE